MGGDGGHENNKSKTIKPEKNVKDKQETDKEYAEKTENNKNITRDQERAAQPKQLRLHTQKHSNQLSVCEQ